MTEDTTQADEMPEMNSFTVTARRTYEVDFSEQQLQQMMEQTGTETPEGAIAKTVGDKEAGFIGPMEKLLSVNVDVESPGDE